MAALCSNVAQAKPKEPESNGIQVGNFVMHPGANVAIAYDGRGADENSDGLIDLGVHFNTHLADVIKHDWTNAVSFNWRQFWGIGDADPNGGPVVDISSKADLFKKNMFRFTPSVSYTFSDEPEDDNLRKDFKNHQLKAGVGFYIQPSGGAVFSQRIGYQFTGHFYSDRADASYIVNSVDSVTRWNFLPQSSMALNIDFRAITYLEDERVVVDNAMGTDTSNYSSFPIRITYSLQGLLLSRLSYILGLGYAYENYENGNKEHMFIMNARLRYDFTDNVGLFLEYRKDFDNIVYGDYYKLHRVDFGFEALWFDHLMTNLDVGFGAFEFKSLEQAERSDYLLSGQAKIYYHFIPGVKLGLEYRLRYNMSNTSGADYFKQMVTLNFAYEY